MDILKNHFREIIWKQLNNNSYKYSNLIKEKNIGTLNSRLENILNYAINNVDFYSNIKEPSIEKFPVLTKDILYKNFSELKSLNYKGHRYLTYSGGSTGKPIPILHCTEYKDWCNASLYNYFNSYLPKTWQQAKTLEIWGSDQDLKKKIGNNFKRKVKENFYGSYFFNCFTMNEQNIKESINQINKIEPFYLKGYINALVLIAKYVELNKLDIYKPKYVLPRTEVLDSYSRKLLQKVFKAEILDMYGSREVSAIAAERPGDNSGNLYVFNENNFLEIDKNNHILITNFHNYSMPIIRFDIGDESSLLSDGNNQQIIGKIKGRICDYLSFKNCKIHSEYFTHKFYNSSIYEFQVQQISFDKIKIIFVD